MQYFLDTKETIPEGLGFELFGAYHLCTIAAAAVICLVLALVYKKLDAKRRRTMRFVIAGLIVADELLKTVHLLAVGGYIAEYLPVHLCSINILLIAIHAFKPTKAMDNYLYGICIPASTLPLLTPTWAMLPPLNLMHIHSLTVHILLLAYPVMLTAGGDIRPKVRALPRSLLLLAGLAVIALGVNLIFDTNFMFLMYAESGTPLVWFAEHMGSHLWGFPILCTAVLAVMFVPVVLLEKRRAGKGLSA